jgi:hypothetical protein
LDLPSHDAQPQHGAIGSLGACKTLIVDTEFAIAHSSPQKAAACAVGSPQLADGIEPHESSTIGNSETFHEVARHQRSDYRPAQADRFFADIEEQFTADFAQRLNELLRHRSSDPLDSLGLTVAVLHNQMVTLDCQRTDLALAQGAVAGPQYPGGQPHLILGRSELDRLHGGIPKHYRPTPCLGTSPDQRHSQPTELRLTQQRNGLHTGLHRNQTTATQIQAHVRGLKWVRPHSQVPDEVESDYLRC